MKSKAPYFSVVIPTFNRAKFIVTAVESVLNQEFTDFELIVVDDGSSDETEYIVSNLAKTDARISYIKQNNAGRSIARNNGIAKATGIYACFLDSDDFWRANHLSVIHNLLCAAPNQVFAFTALAYQFPDRLDEKRFPPIAKSKQIDYVIGNQVSTITVAIPRTTLLTEAFNPDLSINEDLELWARLASVLPIHYVDEVTAVAVQHGDNSQTLALDLIAAQEVAMSLVFSNPKLIGYYSDSFKKRKLQGLLELRIRSYEAKNQKMHLVKSIVKFLVLYPTALRNRSKLVLLLYALPGGSILKRIVQGSNASNG